MLVQQRDGCILHRPSGQTLPTLGPSSRLRVLCVVRITRKGAGGSETFCESLPSRALKSHGLEYSAAGMKSGHRRRDTLTRAQSAWGGPCRKPGTVQRWRGQLRAGPFSQSGSIQSLQQLKDALADLWEPLAD